ncbi:MAG: histidine phosphatase family protein [Planctomycetota bacterium]|nr:histidine phosphatase family protein [Planctomycetota bacterium]
MKTILLLRHAKSSWKDAGQTDHARPLNKRGLRDAPRMGRLIAEQNLAPDLIVSSSAVRAMQSAKAVAEAIDDFTPLVEEDELYLASPRAYIDTARYLEESFQRILLVGHNPGISELLNALTGCDTVMPTAALAQIELSINQWRQLSPQTESRLVALWRPKEIDLP